MQLFGRAMVLVLLALAVFALPVAAQESVTIPLGEQSGSGQSGTAVLTAMGNQTRVVVTLSNRQLASHNRRTSTRGRART